MMATGVKLQPSPDTVPPPLVFGPTGERFDFVSSARAGDGVFRFRWSLQPGKKGPPEHVHDQETETFAIVSGTLRMWIDGKANDFRPGEVAVVRPGSRHRFLNPASEPVVVDVSLDGPLQEDALVPLAYRMRDRKIGLGDLLVMIVHADEVGASRPPSRGGVAIMSGLARLLRWCGVRPLPRVERWA